MDGSKQYIYSRKPADHKTGQVYCMLRKRRFRPVEVSIGGLAVFDSNERLVGLVFVRLRGRDRSLMRVAVAAGVPCYCYKHGILRKVVDSRYGSKSAARIEQAFGELVSKRILRMRPRDPLEVREEREARRIEAMAPGQEGG